MYTFLQTVIPMSDVAQITWKKKHKNKTRYTPIGLYRDTYRNTVSYIAIYHNAVFGTNTHPK